MTDMQVSLLHPHPLNAALYGANEPADDLIESIRSKGILEPLVVKPDGTIISGHRRWRASMTLGMAAVPCRVLAYTDALDEQEAIIEFNRQRVKTFSQKMAEAERLRAIESERAKARQAVGHLNAPQYADKPEPVKETFPELGRGQVRDKVASAVGLGSGKTYEKANKVWQAASAGDETAQKLVEKLDKGQTTINAAYKQVVVNESKQAAIEAIEKAPPATGKYRVVVIDPPWKYDARAEDESHRARNPYPSMTVEDIAALEIPAQDDCVMWLWTTNAFMHDAFHVLEAWGFTPKTILTWEKDRMGTGDWLRGKTEHCVMAVKGKPVINLTNQTTALHGPLREHSRKPDEFYSLVEALCPGSKIEMFARSRREGWASHGAECDRFPAE